MAQRLTILGIESSCDDTAAAVVQLGTTPRSGPRAAPQVVSSIVRGQADLHTSFGGVVPEIAARAHAEVLDLVVAEALQQAKTPLSALDGIAVTAGPGLIGGVVSGVMCAKGLAAATGLPLIGVNHLAGHALTPQLTDDIAFPYLLLLASGGHCQFLLVRGHDEYLRLGGTIDDAPGEAFDKVARLLGLPQPGGPSVEKAAKAGDPKRFAFPRPLLDRPGCDMSFSGLKTALLRLRDQCVAQNGGLTAQDQADLCAGFQAAVVDVFVEKARRAAQIYLQDAGKAPHLAVAGGVAANAAIRSGLMDLAGQMKMGFVAPPLALCTDNAAMIAYAGGLRLVAGQVDDLTLSARPRWPLDQTSPSLLGSGKKGAKA